MPNIKLSMFSLACRGSLELPIIEPKSIVLPITPTANLVLRQGAAPCFSDYKSDLLLDRGTEQCVRKSVPAPDHSYLHEQWRSPLGSLMLL